MPSTRPPRLALMAGIAMLVLWTACAGAQRGSKTGPPPPDPPIQLTLVGINDFHGALLDRPVGVPVDSPRAGGAAMLSAYVGAMRQENPGGVLVVDAGDMLQGPLLCNHFEGAPVAEFYNHLGVAAAAVGNHEFDYGPAGPVAATGADDAPFGALKVFMDQADFPLLSANLSPREWPVPEAIRPRHMVEVQGVRVGLIGISTETTPSQTLQDNVAGVSFDPIEPAMAEQVAALRAEGAEVIVVLAHLDGGCRLDRKWPPPEFCEPDGELLDLLEGGGGRVDAVVVGHRHDWFANLVDGVAVVEAGSRGRALSRVDLFVDPVTRQVVRDLTVVSPPVAACEAVPARGNGCLDPGAEGPWSDATYAGFPVRPDPEVDTLLAPYLDQVSAICAQRLTTAAVPIGGGGGESAAGNLVVDAMRAHVVGSHVAVVNSGALRAVIPEGEVSFCDVYSLFPFDNRFVELRLTGAELERFLEVSTSGAGSMPQISGFRLTVEDGPGVARDLDGDGEQERWEIDRLLAAVDDAGRPVDAEGSYTLLLSDYLFKRPGDMQFVLGAIPGDRISIREDRIRDAIVDLLTGREQPLGADGGWPLPQPDSPRISFEKL